MLKSVRYIGFGSLMRNVHWLYALAAATNIVSCGPSSSSDAKSTAYETDIVDPLRAIGRLTLKTDVIDESASSSRNSHGDRKVSTGKKTTSSPAPRAMTAPTYRRAKSGRLFMKCPSARFPRPIPRSSLPASNRLDAARPQHRLRRCRHAGHGADQQIEAARLVA